MGFDLRWAYSNLSFYALFPSDARAGNRSVPRKQITVVASLYSTLCTFLREMVACFAKQIPARITHICVMFPQLLPEKGLWTVFKLQASKPAFFFSHVNSGLHLITWPVKQYVACLIIQFCHWRIGERNFAPRWRGP